VERTAQASNRSAQTTSRAVSEGSICYTTRFRCIRNNLSGSSFDQFGVIQRNSRSLPLRVLVAVAVLAGVLANACTIAPARPGLRQGGTLSVAIDSEPTSLNPLVAGDLPSIRAYTPLFPLLYSAHTDLSVGPDLASALPTVSASGDVLTVPLRNDAKWSDGMPITADDVVYTVTTEMNPSLDTRASFNWGPLQSVVKVNAHTVKFTLAAPDAAYLANHLVFPVVPQHVLGQVNVAEMSQAPYNSAPSVTGGPFRFNHRVAGQQIVLDASTNYYLGTPHLAHVVEVVTHDPNQVLNHLGSGQLSWAPVLEPGAAAAAASAAGVALNAYPATSFVAVMFNVRRGHPFAEHVARQAFALSIDHDTTVVQASGSAQGVPVWGDINPISWAVDSSALTMYARNPQHARNLVDGRHITTQLIFPVSDPSRASAATLIARQTHDSGFNLTATGLSDQAFAAALSGGNFDAAVVAIPTTLDPDDSAVLASGGGANYGGYTNAALDGLYGAELSATASASATLQQVRKPIFSRIERMVTTDLPLYFLWAPRVFTAFNVTVGGVAGAGAQLDNDRNETFYRDWYLTG